MKINLLFCVGLLSGSMDAAGQAFVNLDFESAVVQPNDITYGQLDWNLAAPGWGHSDGGTTQWIYYWESHASGNQSYLLFDSQSPVWAPGTQLADFYTLGFASGYWTSSMIDQPWINAYISQTGEIPASANSIWMLLSGPFEVQVNGTPVYMAPMGGNLYAGDISAFSGSVSELKILNTSPIGVIHNYTLVDNINFSNAVVPEPSATLLAGFGAIMLCFARRR